MIRGIISPANGQTLDFMLSETRDEAAATTFFTRMTRNNDWPNRVVIDKSGTNNTGLENLNAILLMLGWCWLIDLLQVKYLNNINEQEHRFIKRITRPMKGLLEPTLDRTTHSDSFSPRITQLGDPQIIDSS